MKINIFGYNIKLHWSMLIVFAIGLTGKFGIVYHTLMIAALYVSILLHEFGHVLTAKLYGYKTDTITLMLFGGVAEVNYDFRKNPKSEFWITIFGPLVNFLIFCIITAAVVIFYIFTGFDYEKQKTNLFLNFILELGNLNLLLMLFNLLPIFPMDGGRILRSLVNVFSKDFDKATKIAASVGVVFGIFLLIACFMYNLYTTCFIALLTIFVNLQIVLKNKNMVDSEPSSNDQPSA